MSRRIAGWAIAFVLAGAVIAFTPQLSFAHFGNPQNYQYGHYQDEDQDQDYTPQEVFQIGYRQGLEEGQEHGELDAQRGLNFNYAHSIDYRRATQGWTSDMGYMNIYRRGFQRGYARGYRVGYSSYSDHPIHYSPYRW